MSEFLETRFQGYYQRQRRRKYPWLFTASDWASRVTSGGVAAEAGTGFGWWRGRGQNATAAGVEQDSRAVEKMINRHLVICSVSGGLATLGFFIPPLRLLSIPGILYVAVPTFRGAYRELRDERRVKMTMVYSMLVIGTLFVGSYVAMSIAAGLRLLSQKLLLRTEDTSKQSLLNVLGEQPRFIWVRQGNTEIEIPFEALRIGDIVIAHAGETVPVDGTIIEGLVSIDQRVLTGESQPVEKGVGEPVFASTVVLSGKMGVQVEKAGQDTVAAQIGDVLNRTADFSSAVQLRAQAIGDNSAPPVLALSALTLPLLGPVSAVSVLYASFGYDLRITAPTSALNFLRLASRCGVLIKDGRALEVLHNVDAVVFDKTGTLTLEQPHVGNVYSCSGLTADELLTYAAAAEYRQTHPIARAILQEAAHRTLQVPDIDEAAYEIGYGIKVRLGERWIRVGSARFMRLEGIAIPDDITTQQAKGQAEGYSFVFVAVDEQLGGMVELQATVRPEARHLIQSLRQHNLSVYLLSGDQESPTRRLAYELGIERYEAETLPEHKAAFIERLQQEGKTVCFVGDGINDAIALKVANVSISLRGAASIATDTAQIILLDQSLQRLRDVFGLAYHLEANMRNNVVITVVSSAVTVAGIYFFNVGVVGSLLIYNMGLAAGVINASMPLLTHRNQP